VPNIYENNSPQLGGKKSLSTYASASSVQMMLLFAQCMLQLKYWHGSTRQSSMPTGSTCSSFQILCTSWTCAHGRKTVHLLFFFFLLEGIIYHL